MTAAAAAGSPVVEPPEDAPGSEDDEEGAAEFFLELPFPTCSAEVDESLCAGDGLAAAVAAMPGATRAAANRPPPSLPLTAARAAMQPLHEDDHEQRALLSRVFGTYLPAAWV